METNRKKGEILTKTDVRRIEEEIEYRKGEKRTTLLENLKHARSLGDLSENYEYMVAKRENNKNNSRINYLEKMLRFAQIIDDESAPDVIGINNTVKVYFEEDDETETYRIVTPIRSDSQKNLISNESPLGKALIGHKAGDRVEVRVSDSVSYYVVVKELEKTGESEGDRIKQY